nr:sulfate adenylyltransferase subunit CysN [Bosea sp. 124]
MGHAPADATYAGGSQQRQAPLLRFLTCGSVDDGKSTLIGRLLFDTGFLLDDQFAALERDSLRHGSEGSTLDFALLLDGLEAEREQGITIDVCYRSFATSRRRFRVADTPGHEQYTRNMATGASTADLAVILVDARKGILSQTCRHSCIASLLGIRHVVLAVNKIDLVDFDRSVFDRIEAEYAAFSAKLGFSSVQAIPISARHGDNIVERSARLGWYRGPTLLEHLEEIDVGGPTAQAPLRLPVQLVIRPDADFRGYAGTLASGRLTIGDQIAVAPSGTTATVSAILGLGGEQDSAEAGEAVTVRLDRELDIARGDVLSHVHAVPEVSEQITAHLIWMHESKLVPGRSYVFKIGTQTLEGSVTEIIHLVDVETRQPLAAKELSNNDIGFVHLHFSRPIVFDRYADIPAMGSFIVIDRLSNATVGAGMVHGALSQGRNVHWQAVDLTKELRANALNQPPAVIWFTGLSGSGKSTIANLLERRLFSLGHHTYLIDGDNVRHGLNRDLGFSEADRVENIRRVAEVARLFVDAGLVVLTALISPYGADREAARSLFEPGEFIEVFVDTPLDVAEARDPKGLYRKARAGEIEDFTGVHSPYERPEQSEIRVTTVGRAPEEAVEEIIAYLKQKGIIA